MTDHEILDVIESREKFYTNTARVTKDPYYYERARALVDIYFEIINEIIKKALTKELMGKGEILDIIENRMICYENRAKCNDDFYDHIKTNTLSDIHLEITRKIIKGEKE